MTLSSGQRIGPYLLVERTAADGLAETWKASHLRVRLDVNLHVLPSRWGRRSGYVERFMSEARSLAQLRHPKILRTIDFGHYQGFTYLATVFVGGLPLRHLLGQPWPPAEALLVLEPLAAVLDYAHSRRLPHGDLSPSTVLVTDDGQVMVDGFGIGLALKTCGLAGAAALEQGDSAGERPRHLAPECFDGGSISPGGDLYSLGTIAFELLNGRPPFAMEIWPAKLQPPPPVRFPPSCTLNPDLTPDVVAVLFRALTDDPTRRFLSATALVRALEASSRRESDDTPEGVVLAEAGPGLKTEPLPTSPDDLVKERPARRMSELATRLRRVGWKRALAGLSAATLMAMLLNLAVVQPTASLLAGRADHAAVPLEGGETLLVGGCTNIPPSRSIAALARGFLSIGAKGAGLGWLDTALLYSPNGGWMGAGRLAQGRCAPRAAGLPGGQVLVVAGQLADGQPVATAERYSRATNSWRPAGKLLISRTDFATIALPSGQVLVLGGSNPARDAEPLASAERYDPITNNWSLAPSLTQARKLHSATLLADGQLLVAGGAASGSSSLSSAERLSPAGGSWTSAGTLQQARARHTATLLGDGRVLVIGGSGERNALASAERYDPLANTWTRLASLSEARAGHTATLLRDGEVLVVGGAGLGKTLASAERYNPETNAWLPAGSLPEPRLGHTASLLPDGRVLVAGGRGDPHGPYLSTAALYDPTENRWAPTADLPP